ncbi:unnamed protein product [Prunus armeniaca]|uniref:Cupin type-1 domain-containing protein n=1 Tax=Prunus armeniaca TaxID=36596 RepID=A0A6J5XWE4_PRUAR|nr:hypothetical protein GBA52_023430 [Prunus armeniaca]CAB4287632.1 unnamed protein product [Prunus armeniaca]CAB4317999.1 unnamed protein product [Prunus armeniaca]
MLNKSSNQQPFPFTFFILLFIGLSLPAAKAILSNEEQYGSGASAAAAGSLVKRDQRRALVVTEYGEISSIDISDGHRGPYHIQFITLEPNSLFLPVLLHADMVLYVHTGSGRLSWGDEDDIKRVAIKRGDLFRLRPGSVFFVQSDLQAERQKLRIYAIFATNTDDDLYDPAIGAYSSVRDLVRAFDPKVLRSAFKVSDEVIESIINGTDQSGIVHAVPTKKETFWDLEARFLKTFLTGKDGSAFNKNKKKTKTYNIFDEDPDFKNCNGWSLTVNKKNSQLLKGSNIGLFMVNLTKGSMMGPHWNPRATEIAIVLHGQGMVRVVCSSTAAKKSECKSMRLRVHEGDVFAVPRFHPMAQMTFNNDSLVFMGFSTTTRRNYPQFLAGKYSVLQSLDKQVLAASFNVSNTTVDQLLAAQADSVIIDCTSCAEEEERVMLEEIEKEREEQEAKKWEEEEAGKRAEEKEQRKREEEEAARKREEEEAAARKREEEEAAKKREEEAAAARQREKEQEAERQREEEQAAKQREEEEAKKREGEGRQSEEERRQEEETERERQQQKEWERREQEAQTEQEEARRQQEEREGKERPEESAREEEGRQREEERRQEEETERERQQQKEWERREQEAETEQEEARRQQEEREGKERPEESAGRQPEEREGGGRGIDVEEGKRYLRVLRV